MHLLIGALLLIAFGLIVIVWRVYATRTYAAPKAYTLEFLNQPSLGPYYMDLEHKLDHYPNRDIHGGILETYPKTGQRYFHPIRNTHYALALYARYLQIGNVEDREEFLNIANAIIVNGIKREDGSRVWYYPHSYFKGQKTPWISAMAQGQVIAVMARAYECTSDTTYLDAAREAFVPFSKKISDGGVCSDDQSLGVFYEEYAHEELHSQHHTLNGMLSALFGLYDYWKLTGDAEVREAFAVGVNTIKQNLILYDLSFCSAYDLRHVLVCVPPLVSAHYNAVHVAHLHILAAMTGDAYFDNIATCWNNRLEDKLNRLRLAVAILTWQFHHLFGRMRDVIRG